MLPIAAIFIAPGLALWRWRRFQPEIGFDSHCVHFSSRGARFQRPQQRWPGAESEPLEVRILNIYRGRNIYFFDFYQKVGGETKPRIRSLFVNGLEDSNSEVLAAMNEAARQNGDSLIGPPPPAKLILCSAE